MYLDFFGLKKEPFGITPDPAFLFLSPSHKEALAGVIYGIRMRKGFVVTTGEVGVGKTTILRSYLEQNAGDRLKAVYLFHTKISFPALLRTICRELSLPVSTENPDEMLTHLHRFLIEEYRRGGNIVLVIDEAQNMPIETLESIRMLSNLETASDKLIQIIFSGQPEFDEFLDCHELRQLKQRVAVRTTIRPLTVKESAAYILHRLARAGYKGPALFTPGALKSILARARGIPRLLNIYCDNALITACGYRKKQVTRAIVEEILRDIEGEKKSPRRAWWLAAAAMLLILAGAPGLLHLSGPTVLNIAHEKSEADSKPQPIRHNIALPVSDPASRQTEQGGLSLAGAVKRGEMQARMAEDVTFIPKPIPEKISIPSVETTKAPYEGLSKTSAATEGEISVTRVVEAGDTLARLVEEVYGRKDKRLIALVKRHNVGIEDVDRIVVGEEIIFPAPISR